MQDSNFTNAVFPIPVSPIKIVGVFAAVLKKINAILKKLSEDIAIHSSYLRRSVGILVKSKFFAFQSLIIDSGNSLQSFVRCLTSKY